MRRASSPTAPRPSGFISRKGAVVRIQAGKRPRPRPEKPFRHGIEGQMGWTRKWAMERGNGTSSNGGWWPCDWLRQVPGSPARAPRRLGPGAAQGLAPRHGRSGEWLGRSGEPEGSLQPWCKGPHAWALCISGSGRSYQCHALAGAHRDAGVSIARSISSSSWVLR